MKPFKEMILDEHNYYRNKIASGTMKCFYPAVRMPYLVRVHEYLFNSVQPNEQSRTGYNRACTRYLTPHIIKSEAINIEFGFDSFRFMSYI